MVATAHHHATDAGVEILAAGGNAIDAAMAAAFALGVCEPAASGLGGQTMMMIYHVSSGRTIALDGSSRAPNRATRDILLSDSTKLGYMAATVPSTPAALRYALETYGTMKLAQVLEPAIALAEGGYRVSELQNRLTRRELTKLRAHSAGQFLLKNGDKPFPAGALHKQPVLAETLRRLARHGVRDFYSGRIARQIDADMTRNGGLIRLDDLAQVPRPIERRPLTCRFGPYRVFTFPPPGAGRTLVQMLNVYQRLPVALRNLDSAPGAVALAETIRTTFLDRQDRPLDPNFYPQLSQKKMLSLEYAKKIAAQVAGRVPLEGETTHLSAMDAEGNVVSLTQSIEKVYGSCCATPELGFLYNDYMSAFEYEDISHPYYLRPNAVPWASVAPTIVFRGPEPWLAIGSPGSERITPSILQVLLRLRHQSPFLAVDAPRLHCSIAGKVSLEAARMSDEIPQALEQQGFEVDRREPYSFYLGCVQLVLRENGRLTGVADPRRDGAAGGPPR
jgi:gamma-glutamyltranspeptidase/glutathione hydrolase